MLNKRLHLQGTPSENSSTGDSSADMDLFYGQFLGERQLLHEDFLGSSVYRIAYIGAQVPLRKIKEVIMVFINILNLYGPTWPQYAELSSASHFRNGSAPAKPETTGYGAAMEAMDW
jgi:hypothetical protein